jgi:hypothetical protein
MNIVTDGGNAYGGLIFGVVNNLVADAKNINGSPETAAGARSRPSWRRP